MVSKEARGEESSFRALERARAALWERRRLSLVPGTFLHAHCPGTYRSNSGKVLALGSGGR